jgi:hypothetical protein
MVAGTVLVARAPMFVKLTLQPAGGHHLPTLHVTMGPSLDDGIGCPEPEAAAAAGQNTANTDGRPEQEALPEPVPVDRGATTGPTRAVAPRESLSPRLPGVVEGPTTKDQTSSAVADPPRGVSPDAVFPGVQGTGIRALTLAGVRIPQIPRLSWFHLQRIVGVVIARFKVQKVPPPPAAQ